VTQSLRDRRVLKASDVAGQPTGHFSGRILGGKPPFFSAQFKFSEFPAEEIPRFNLPVKMGDEETEELILKEVVRENYEQVRREVKDLMDGYE